MLRSISNCSVHLWCYYRHDHPVWNLWLHHWQEGLVDRCFSPTDLLNESFLQGSSVSWINLDKISSRVSFGCTFWGWDWSNSWTSFFCSPEEMPAEARNNGICQALDSFFLNVLRLSMPEVQQQLELGYCLTPHPRKVWRMGWHWNYDALWVEGVMAVARVIWVVVFSLDEIYVFHVIFSSYSGQRQQEMKISRFARISLYQLILGYQRV